VVPASEVRRQSVASVRDAQRSFGVNLAVTGSVQRTAGGVRLTVNLDDARTLRQLGARAVDVAREELSKMEDRLLNLVAELLEMQLQPQARSALRAGSTSVSDAYDAYLQGRGYLQRYDKPGNVERAISVFQEALKRDPHYALAYAGLGEAYLRSFGRDKDPHWLELAQGAGARAVELNGQLAPAHVNLGMVYAATGRLEKAVGEFKIALDLDPISVAAYRELAGAYEAQNKMKDAEDTYKRAIQLRPGDWVSNGLLGTFFYRHGRYTEAEPLFRKIIELTPDNFNGYLNLGGLYTALGRYEEAETLLKKSNEVRPTYRAYSNLGTLYYQRGRYAEAVSMFEKAVVELGAGVNHVVVGNLADSYRWAPGLAQKAPPAYRRAIELAEQQLAINPEDATVLSRLAAYHAEVGEKDKALSDIRRARKLAPADNSVGFRAVLVYELAGRRDDALAALEEVLKGGYALEQVEREPEFEKMRQDPRYSGIKSRYGAGKSNNRSK
jgi:serine/threonine-protein kinase